MIDGVIIKDLKVIKDERGGLFEILRSDSEGFLPFGQAYITIASVGIVKAWHYHKNQTDRWIVVKGIARVMLVDTRHKSPTDGEYIDQNFSEHNPQLLIIPERVIHGFENISNNSDCWIMNIPDKLFNYKKPDEYRLPFNDPCIINKIAKAWYNQKGG